VNKSINKVSGAGLLLALGIIYGDIGTSPLYVFNSIVNGRMITEPLVIGSLSCIIWTITFQTTLKYVLLISRADNKGEGGIFALYALVRRRRKWLLLPAIIGGAALLADGIITPPISITSAVEGLQNIPIMHHISANTIMIIVLAILLIFFFLQQFGTGSIGRLFGPVMFIWFTMIAVLGCIHLLDNFSIFKAFNPYYAINFLINYKGAFVLLGAVFLCTTGAEALYSDLGHSGKGNLRVSWIYVKACLLLNYIGQGSYLLAHREGLTVTAALKEQLHLNTFYDLMPSWFVIVGVIIATSAAIIASQAMIASSFTLIGEAIRLNLWPKLRVKYPSEARGQLFIPAMNVLMFIGCAFVIIYFKQSSKMEAAYGLAIIITMIATTILFANYMVMHRVQPVWIYMFLVIYLTIELTFLAALSHKFLDGGYITTLLAAINFSVMYIWFRSRKIKNRYIEFVRLDHYIPMIQELSNDKSITKYATHLIYLTASYSPREIEHKIIYSILNKKPKRADIYWFVHVDTVDNPYTCEYIVDHIIPNDIIRIDFRLGFRVQQRISLMLRKVIQDLVTNNEVNITSRYESLERNSVVGDFQFVILEKYLSPDNELPFFEKIIMKLHFWLKEASLNEERGFGLDPSFVTVEKFPLMVSQIQQISLHRVFDEFDSE
jgi:KUP system potassium uptake protein